MKYVLDSSVALKWVLPEADSAKAIRLRDEYKKPPAKRRADTVEYTLKQAL
jgi:hypothetical protein